MNSKTSPVHATDKLFMEQRSGLAAQCICIHIQQIRQQGMHEVHVCAHGRSCKGQAHLALALRCCASSRLVPGALWVRVAARVLALELSGREVGALPSVLNTVLADGRLPSASRLHGSARLLARSLALLVPWLVLLQLPIWGLGGPVGLMAGSGGGMDAENRTRFLVTTACDLPAA